MKRSNSMEICAILSNYHYRFYLIMVWLFLFPNLISSQDIAADSANNAKIKVSYLPNKGFQLSTLDNNYSLQLGGRLQFRFATPSDQNPLSYDEVFDTTEPVFKINRARLKVGGNAFKPYLEYYFEYELSQSNLLDFRVMFKKWKEMSIKIGQWKTYFNRERVISSGKQQMVERSIINRPFTIDRQQGISFYGRLFENSLTDITYHLSILTGTGRGATVNDDGHLMYVGRLQWNFLGREVSMSGSDLDFTEKPTALVALAGATNRSPYTRFSQAGGGQLEGFEDGLPGQYRVNQFMIETAFKYRGFSWQSEIHTKTIDDKLNLQETTLTGNYFQAGYFFSNIVDFVPKSLEVAGRFATYRLNIDVPDNLEHEYAMAFNWFFKGGHRNKITTEFTYFDFETALEDQASGWRFRVQWDISF